MSGELGAPVRNDIPRESMEPKHMIQKQACGLLGWQKGREE